jgi:hypothetical protein
MVDDGDRGTVTRSIHMVVKSFTDKISSGYWDRVNVMVFSSPRTKAFARVVLR